MKKPQAEILTLAVAALLLLPAGCAGLFSGDSPPLSMFTDIPLPPELTVDEENCLVNEYPIGRLGLMKTNGRIGKQALLTYFRTVMPQNGWQRESEFDNGQQHMMIFSKSPRSAAITVTEGWFNTDVEINVSAKKEP